MTADAPDSRAAENSRTASLVPRSVRHPDASSMLREFYDDQIARYGFAESVDLDPAMYDMPNGVFVVVYLGGAAVGCGGCRWYDRPAGIAEIKKTYVAPAARGAGVGRQLLLWLEDQARSWGVQHVILETGVRNTAALALFASHGYQSMPQYVHHRDPAINRAFTKSLGPATRSPHSDESRAHA